MSEVSCPSCGRKFVPDSEQHASIELFNECVRCRFVPGGSGSKSGTEADMAKIQDRYHAMHGQPIETKVLPVEPTPAMLQAGFLTGNDELLIDQPADAPGLVWAAMLAAAPDTTPPDLAAEVERQIQLRHLTAIDARRNLDMADELRAERDALRAKVAALADEMAPYVSDDCHWAISEARAKGWYYKVRALLEPQT